GKFTFQSTDPRSPLSMLRPIVQIDRAEYTALLKNTCGSRLAEIIEAKPKAVQTSASDGAIYRIELDNGEAIEADFYADVSGAVGRLTGGFSGSDWNSLVESLPFDRLLAARDPEPPIKAEKQVVAQAIKGGLLITTPLRNSSIAQLLYASSHLTGEEEQKLVGREARVALFEPGYVGQPWMGNLARMGTAASNFGPFLSADVTILHHEALVLADHLPTRANMTVEAREYNRRHLIAAEQVRDFTLLPFALNRRDDVPWFRIQEKRMPETLVRKIEQFRSRGRFVAYDGEIFD
ncbi:MAG: tryptophan 7-halogenase, partial [Parasphingorhabdus sp.]